MFVAQLPAEGATDGSSKMRYIRMPPRPQTIKAAYQNHQRLLVCGIVSSSKLHKASARGAAFVSRRVFPAFFNNQIAMFHGQLRRAYLTDIPESGSRSGFDPHSEQVSFLKIPCLTFRSQRSDIMKQPSLLSNSSWTFATPRIQESMDILQTPSTSMISLAIT